jgi:hypothetical protein
VVAGAGAEAGDGVAVDADQPAGLADADALGDVGQDGNGGGGGQAGVKQRGALALGEAGLTGAAAEQPAPPVGAVAGGDGEVVQAPLTEVGAAVVLAAAEGGEVVHDGHSPRETGLVCHRGWLYKRADVSTTLKGHDPVVRPAISFAHRLRI